MLTGIDISDLEVSLADTEIFNDARALIPRYEYAFDLSEEPYVAIPVDLVYRMADQDSINKYGRRTRIQKYHVMEQAFAEAYCAGTLDRYHEPMHKLRSRLIGKAENLLKILSFKVSDQVTFLHAPCGLNDTFILDSLAFEVDTSRVPILEVMLTEARPLELLDVFHIDADLIDGEHVIG